MDISTTLYFPRSWTKLSPASPICTHMENLNVHWFHNC